MTIAARHPAPAAHEGWKPDLSRFEGPCYLAVADALAAAIAAGELAPGDRLPTHRDLADRLGVTVGTVTRAYMEAARRGLTDGAVGRGTFVRTPERPYPIGSHLGHLGADSERVAAEPSQVINLSVNRPAIGPQTQALREALARLAAREDLEQVMGYQFPAGHPSHRAAGAAWLARAGLETVAARVLVTAGCQNAQTVALATVTRPGDVLLTEALAYPGLTALARRLGLVLDGIAMDDEGVLPDALEAACRGGGRRFAYLTPTVQNPTTAVMGERRRREIAAVIRRHDVILLEDDVHGFLGPERTPLAMLAPDHTLFMTSLSKALMPGLRVGYLAVPPRLVDAAIETMRATTLMAPPMMAQIAADWILDGTAGDLTKWQIDEIADRNRVAERILDTGPRPHGARSFHIWLELPAGRSAEEVAAAARDVGVHVVAQSSFRVGSRYPGEGVRVSLSAAADRAQLRTGLDRLASVLNGCPAEPAII